MNISGKGEVFGKNSGALGQFHALTSQPPAHASSSYQLTKKWQVRSRAIFCEDQVSGVEIVDSSDYLDP